MNFWRGTVLGLDPVQTRSATAEERETESKPAPGAMPPSRTERGVLGVLEAMSLPAVLRSVQIISTAIAQLTITVWRGGDQLTPTPLLVTQPDLSRSLSSFLKRTVINLATRGNAYWWIKRNDRGQVVSLTVLASGGISWHYDGQGVKTWHYAGRINGRWASRSFKADEIQHLRFLEVEDLEVGLGPIQACRVNLGGALDVRDYGSNWFENTDVPSGLLTTTGNVKPSEANAIKEGWRQNNREYGVSVLGNGLTYSPILLNPSDAQWLESQNFSVTDVARMFGIHPALLAAAVEGSGSMTYTTLEQVDTQQTRTTYMTYIQEIQDAFSLLLPRGQVAKLAVADLERSDNKTRADINKIYVDLGVIEREEVRLAEGYGPMPAALKARNNKPQPAPPAPAPDTEEDA